MARSLLVLSLAMQNPSFSPVPVNFLFVILSVFSVFSITAFLCASHKNRGFQRQKNNEESISSERKLLSKINSNLGSKAQLIVKMISWRKVQADEEEEDYDGSDDDEAVWRKTIIKGGRCRPLDFSGKILYDSQGNLLPAESTQGDQSNKVNPLGKC